MLPEQPSHPQSRPPRALRLHGAGFVVVNAAALLLASLFGTSSIWSVTLLVTGAALLVHWIGVRVTQADDTWADERANVALRRGYERAQVMGHLRDRGLLKTCRAPDEPTAVTTTAKPDPH
ncbi:MAG: hypothetical protein AAFR55_06740 [Pseudomonadota bacterium]